jgi:hypothetical protein
MSSRLNKIYLVNAKTSGSTASGRISEIDPRGGAAVTGANGAGKTTTLQVIGLFFGYSPNQLVQAGENRESMLRFILPNPESAVVFEYERGDDEQDVCHVILRREDNSDVGEYRFVRGPMRKDLLLAHDASGERVFLDDEGTQLMANRLGLGEDFSRKLKLAAYRSVILNVPGAGKDNINRRQLAARFSFSRKPLMHLDRLVAAVISEHIDFDVFADVAATIVMDKIGTDTGQSSKEKQLRLRQSRGQIEQWLRDRDAVDRALGERVESEVNQLRDLIAELRALDMKLGIQRSNCTALTSINESLLDVAKADLAELQNQRQSLEGAFTLRKDELERAIATAQEVFSDRANEYDVLLRRKQYLHDNDAELWERTSLNLEGMKGHAHAQQVIVDGIKNTVKGVDNDYLAREQTVERETNRQVDSMRKEIPAAQKRHDTEVVTLQDQESRGLKEINDQFLPRKENANQKVEECIREEAQGKADVQRPGIDPNLEGRLKHAQKSFENHQNAVIDAQKAHSTAQNSFNTLDRQWGQAQRHFESQRDHLAQDRQTVELIKSRLRPAPQSLHTAFLDNSDAAWAENLAKIIDPALLTRVDLQPHFTGESDSLAYGWGINLDAIERPKWVDQEDLHRQLDEASRAVQTSESRLSEAQKQFDEIGKQREAADEAVKLKEAALNVVSSKSTEFKSQLAAIQNAVASATNNAKVEAQRRLENAQSALKSAREAFRVVNADCVREVTDKQHEFNDQRETARKRRDATIAETEDRIKAFKDQQARAIEALHRMREDKLRAKGVDMDALSRKEKALAKLVADIQEIEDHAPIAREWRNWMDSQGPNRLIDTLDGKERAEKSLRQAKDNLTVAEKKQRGLIDGLKKDEDRANDRIKRANDELSILRGVAAEVSQFAPYGVSTMTVNDLAGEVKGQVHGLLGQFGSKRKALQTKKDRVERELCSGESSTRDFVQGVMREVTADAQDIDVANALVKSHGRIRTEVLVNVNLSLRTMLDGIKNYRDIISDFESEVRKFNDKLQDGLKRVSSKFERFRDFNVNVVSDLSKLDFVGKLKLLDEVIADHRSRNAATYSIEVPSAQAAQSLRTFMGALSAGTMEINLGKHITLSGSVIDDGVFKTFHSAKELEKISSNGLTAIALISLLSGLLNMIRGTQDIYIPWATDEVGRFDGGNFQRLMQMMAENKIDAVTASPALTPACFAYFAHRYVFKAKGVIAEYRPRFGPVAATV